MYDVVGSLVFRDVSFLCTTLSVCQHFVMSICYVRRCWFHYITYFVWLSRWPKLHTRMRWTMNFEYTLHNEPVCFYVYLNKKNNIAYCVYVIRIVTILALFSSVTFLWYRVEMAVILTGGQNVGCTKTHGQRTTHITD